MVHPILTCRSIQAEDSFTQITGIFFGGFVSLSYIGGFSYNGWFCYVSPYTYIEFKFSYT